MLVDRTSICTSGSDFRHYCNLTHLSHLPITCVVCLKAFDNQLNKRNRVLTWTDTYFSLLCANLYITSTCFVLHRCRIQVVLSPLFLYRGLIYQEQ